MRAIGRYSPRSHLMGRTRPSFQVTIVGPPGPSQRRLLETLRENGYTVSEPERLSVGSTTWRVTVQAPHGETNG
jgi:hypothetical protein